MTTASIAGSCLCGEVRFELTREPVGAVHCHCSRCRKTSGTAFASNLFFRYDALRYTQGEDHLRSYKPPEAERFTHVFCNRCGSTYRSRAQPKVSWGFLWEASTTILATAREPTSTSNQEPRGSRSPMASRSTLLALDLERTRKSNHARCLTTRAAGRSIFRILLSP
jgi:hypothetical protein